MTVNAYNFLNTLTANFKIPNLHGNVMCTHTTISQAHAPPLGDGRPPALCLPVLFPSVQQVAGANKASQIQVQDNEVGPGSAGYPNFQQGCAVPPGCTLGYCQGSDAHFDSYLFISLSLLWEVIMLLLFFFSSYALFLVVCFCLFVCCHFSFYLCVCFQLLNVSR